MSYGKLCRGLSRLALVAMSAAGPVPALAADVYLVAKPLVKTMPDGAAVPMWGFALAEPGFSAVGLATVPGPALAVPPGETSLNLYLRNELPVPVSLVIPGQRGALAPERFTDPQGRSRINSFAATTAPGAVGVYGWTGLRPGTYLYQSGTHVSVQVPMGLYGAFKADAAAGVAYPGASYDNEVLMLYSEVDPALSSAIVNGTYGSPSYPSTMSYRPRYFLVNGGPYPSGVPVLAGPITVNQRVLFRFLNAGVKEHVPTFEGGLYPRAIAEDGSPYRYPREAYSVPLPPLKTVDALLVPTAAGPFAVYDGRLFLTSADVAPGGMLARLEVVAAGGAPTANDDAFTTFEDTALSQAAPGVLGNDTGAAPSAQLVSDVGSGALQLNPDGSFTYTPNGNFDGTDLFTYRALDGAVPGNVATVRITMTPVNDAPVSANDAAATMSGTPVVIPALGNDTDAEGDALAVEGFTQPVRGAVVLNPDRTFTYSANPGTSGVDSFTYSATDGALAGNVATVTVSVSPRLNQPPVAADDFGATRRATPVRLDVIANDHDPDGTIAPATVVVTSGPTRGGSVTTHGDGTLTYTPRGNFKGTDVFTYRVRDDEGAASNPATVQINVTR